MIIKRKLFSKKEENKNSNDTSSKAKGTALYLGGAVAGQGIAAPIMMKHMQDEPSEESAKIAEKLKRLASRRGHKVDNITYTGMGPAYQNNKIYTSGTKAADVLSHEMGHAHYDKRKVKSVSDAIGKVAHKAYLKTGGMLNHTVLAPTAGIIAGVRSGKKAAEKEAAGEKESKLSRHSGWASGLAVQSPGLVSEAMASKHGLDLMKKAGASKKLMKASRKNLGVALGTYAGVAVTNAGMSELARGIAYRKKKKKLEKEKDKKKDDK
jgi:hypothetical protein